jgi:mono/diheme cytochrome c family protein
MRSLAGTASILALLVVVVSVWPAEDEPSAQEFEAVPPGAEAAPFDSAPVELTNPYRGRSEVLAEGERIYRGRCYGCHFRGGGRGPNIFQTTLADAQFMDAVLRGRPNGMPAWSGILSADEIWKVHAFVLSRDRL